MARGSCWCWGLSYAGHAFAALEFFSIKDNAVIMYDAPSLKADKLYVASRHLPVEAVVKVEGWVKVRDSGGSLAWVEEKAVKRQTLCNCYRTAGGSLSGRKYKFAIGIPGAAKCVMELLEPAANGWVKVRHRDGQIGYIRTTSGLGFMRIAVLGAGAWGTALAISLSSKTRFIPSGDVVDPGSGSSCRACFTAYSTGAISRPFPYPIPCG